MTVGFHSPLPPAATGVAAYAATLLAALRERGEVTPGARDAGGNVTTYGYDAIGQLTHLTLPGGTSITYVYNAAGP